MVKQSRFSLEFQSVSMHIAGLLLMLLLSLLIFEGSSILVCSAYIIHHIHYHHPLSSLSIQHKYIFDIFIGFMLKVHSLFFLQGEHRVKKEAERPSSPEGRPDFRDNELEQHITPLTLKPKIKQNPLYVDLRTVDMEENQRYKPSWTIEDYDRHSLHGNLASYQVQTGITCIVTQKIVLNKR